MPIPLDDVFNVHEVIQEYIRQTTGKRPLSVYPPKRNKPAKVYNHSTSCGVATSCMPESVYRRSISLSLPADRKVNKLQPGSGTVKPKYTDNPLGISHKDRRISEKLFVKSGNKLINNPNIQTFAGSVQDKKRLKPVENKTIATNEEIETVAIEQQIQRDARQVAIKEWERKYPNIPHPSKIKS